MSNGTESCCRCCFGFIFTLGLTALFIWLSLRVSSPKCRISSFYIPALNQTLNAPKNTTLYFQLRLENTNKDKGVYYDPVNVTFFDSPNRSHSIGNYTVPGFYQGHKKKATKGGSVETSGLDREAVVKAAANKSAVFGMNMDTRVRYKILFWKTKRHKIMVPLDFHVTDQGALKSNAEQISCYSGKVGFFLDVVSHVRANDEHDKLLHGVDDGEELCDLPVIDISRLTLGVEEREKCIKEIGEAASQWGFFQIFNHGIPQGILDNWKREQMNVFHRPFDKKAEDRFLNSSGNSYRWGNPKATCLRQLSWSEAYHIPLTDISKMGKNKLGSTVEVFARQAAALAQRLAEVLAENLGVKSTFFEENCSVSTSYLRMNRYPPCPFSPEVNGFMPHSDSDFLTIVLQYQVGGLQLLRDGRWISVRADPKYLVVNIGDLFQEFSNDVYRSIRHRVVAPREVERFSLAYFYCPSIDAMIQSCRQLPAKYRKFSFREYREQIQKDVGVSFFLL